MTEGSRVETSARFVNYLLSTFILQISSSALKCRTSSIYGLSQRSRTVRCSKPAEGEIFRHPSGKDRRPIPCFVQQCRCPLPEKTRRGGSIEYQPQSAPRFKMSGAMPPLPLCAIHDVTYAQFPFPLRS